MIVTCTMNPSLDYFLEFDKRIKNGAMNRAAMQYFRPAGKGINVSVVLNNLQIPSRATGFLGGFVRDFYVQLLQQYPYIEPSFTYIPQQTRINVKVADNKEETELNVDGPAITDSDMKKLKEKVERLNDGDYFVLAGHCQEYLFDTVDQMLAAGEECGAKICLDTNIEIIEKTLARRPFMVKRRVRDLGQRDGDDAAIEQAAQALHEAGAQHVLVLGDDSRRAWMVCDQGTYVCDVLYDGEKAVITVGAGDAMQAGFLMDWLRSMDALDSFRYGCAAARAAALSYDFGGREEVESGYQSRKVVQK